jgi:thioredoxin-like negative regulator of GroEL
MDNMTSSEIFEKIERTPHMLVYFSFPGCSVCVALLPKIEKLVQSFVNVEFLYVNTHETPEVSGQYLVFTVPTVILFSHGAERKRWSRVFSVEDVEDSLARLSA